MITKIDEILLSQIGMYAKFQESRLGRRSKFDYKIIKACNNIPNFGICYFNLQIFFYIFSTDNELNVIANDLVCNAQVHKGFAKLSKLT